MARRAAGQSSGRTVAPRHVLKNQGAIKPNLYGFTMDETKAYDGARTGFTNSERYIRGGWLLGADMSTKKVVPLKRTTAVGSGSSSTSLTVTNAAAFVGAGVSGMTADSIFIGPSNTAVAISSINYSTNVITLASAKSWSDGAPVYVSGGYGRCAGILVDEEVILYDEVTKTFVAQNVNVWVGDGEGFYDTVLGDLAAAFSDPFSRFRTAVGHRLDKYIDHQQTMPAEVGSIFTYVYNLADGAAGADLAETILTGFSTPATLRSVRVIAQGSVAGVDNSNTSVWTVRRGVAGSTSASKTYNATTTFPASAGLSDTLTLGSAGTEKFGPGDVLTLEVTNGSTANLPACVVVFEFMSGITSV